MNWYNFLLKIVPNGKAFRSIKYTKILLEVMAYAFNLGVDYAILSINDQVWFVNDNFDPIPWEARYSIIPPEFSTLNERRAVIKSYMLYPQSQNRLSLDYMQSVIDDSGFTDILLTYNPSGTDDGIMQANDFSNEKASFLLGTLTYNSFRISGVITLGYYITLINLVMSLKPLQVAMYNEIELFAALAIDDTLALAIDDNFTLAINL